MIFSGLKELQLSIRKVLLLIATLLTAFGFSAEAAYAGGATSGVFSITTTQLVQASQGVAYNQDLVTDLGLTGGTTPRTFTLLTGPLPTGLMLNSDGTMTGVTCDANGSYKFSASVSDGTHTGTFALQINVTTSPGFACSLILDQQTLNASTYVGATFPATVITPTNGSGSAYTYSLSGGSLPSGITPTFDASTGALTFSGTVTATPGTYNFSYLIADVNGKSTVLTGSITVAADANSIVIAPGSLPSGTVGSAYSQAITTSGGSGTVTCTSTVSPAGSNLTLLGAPGSYTIGGTPETPGTYSISVTCQDSATPQNVTTQTYSVVIVDDAALALGPNTLDNPIQGIPYAQTATHTVLGTGGSGGGYSYQLTAGALPPGLSLNSSTGAITGTTRASGPYTFTIEVTDSLGNTASRTYTLTIQEREDPTLDREVIGLINAQFSTASRFAEGQLNNAMRHAEGLHNGLRCAVDNGLTVSAASTNVNNSNTAGADGRNAAASNQSPTAYACDDSNRRISVWTAGSIDKATDGSHRFNADAVTMGVDVQVADKFIAGAAFGLGWNDSTIGSHGTSSDDKSTTAMLYGSFKVTPQVFLDIAAGKTWLTFDGQRYLTPEYFAFHDATFISGQRKGDVTFGSAALTFEQPVGALLLAGNLRYDYINSNLNRYAEAGSSAYALTYNEAHQLVQLLGAGLRAETTFLFDWGKLSPVAHLEYRHRVAGDYDQVLAYSDILTRTYTLHQDKVSSNMVSASIGARATVGDTELSAEYGSSSTSLGSFRGGEVRVGLRQRF